MLDTGVLGCSGECQEGEHWRNTTHVPSRTLARTPVQTLVLPGVDRETDLRQVPKHGRRNGRIGSSGFLVLQGCSGGCSRVLDTGVLGCSGECQEGEHWRNTIHVPSRTPDRH